MKPHALRRGLWLANLALAAAVVGLGVWYALEVKPAVASVVKRGKNERPKDLEAMRADYEKARVSGLKWKPEAPVSDKELYATILRADYKKKSPTHWIFSGPLPPTEIKRDKPVETGPPPPEGLDVLGKIAQVIVNPPNSTILFKFKGGKSRAFGIGDYVRLASADAERFRISKIVELDLAVYEIHYDVFGKDPDKPERSAVLSYDRSGKSKEYPPFLRVDGAATPKAPATAGGTGAAAGTGTGEGTAAEGTTPAGETPAAEGEDGSKTEIVTVARKPAEQLTLEDLKPKILENPNNKRQKAVVFDDNTYRYFKGRNVKTVAQTVKTAIAKDKDTGQVIGLRITGFAEEAPADVFDVRKGDILVSINGQKIASRADAIRVAQGLKDANIVTVVIDRRGKLVTYRVDAQDPRNRRKVRYFEGFAGG
ncbi:MAG: PDZ domain-containing protein [Planctomycetota bacterium]|nr:PDZ domain-containing protein [Planctomycetota bacterium]